MGQSLVRVRRPPGRRGAPGLLAVVAFVGLLGLPIPVARANATWTGSSTSPEWSAGGNWSGSPPAGNGSAGTLTFPNLNGCAAPRTCFISHNGLTGVSATGLVFSNSSGEYRILGNGLTIGSGGIWDAAGGGAGTTINAPLALSSSQTWTVGSSKAGYNVLTVVGGVTGSSSDSLRVTMPAAPLADLFVDSNMEVGPVTVAGAGRFHIGGAPGSNDPGSVNASDGEPVTLTGATLIANPGAMTGPLTMTGGTLLLGTNTTNTGATTLSIKGAAAVGSSTTTTTFIDANGAAPGTDFSQLSASGNIALGGQLAVGQGTSGGACVPLAHGDVATLIATGGTITGTFANAPNGAILAMTNSCEKPAPQFQVHYTSTSVMAEIVSGTAPTTPPASTKPRSKSKGRLVGPGGRLVVVGRRTRVIERCRSRRLCRGSFSLTASKRAHRHKRPVRVRCGQARFRIRAGHSMTIRVRLTTACLRLLHAAHHRRLTVLYLSRTRTGQAGQRRLVTLVLKAPTRRRRR